MLTIDDSMKLTFKFAIPLFFAALFVACGSAPTHPVPPGFEDVARIHRTKCGACHLRVEPGARTRAQLEAAFPRHHMRVKMSDDDWAKMVDYLAAQEPTQPTAPASSPSAPPANAN